MATAFEQQRADAEVLAELIDGLGEVDRGLAGDDVGNSFLPEHGQVVSRHSLADDADKMIAVEIAARPSQLAERVHRYGIGLCAAGDENGLRPGGRDRGGDKRRVLRKVLHRRAAANPGIAFELRAGGVIIALPGDCIESVAVDLSIHGREHVADDIWFHSVSPLPYGVSAIDGEGMTDHETSARAAQPKNGGGNLPRPTQSSSPPKAVIVCPTSAPTPASSPPSQVTSIALWGGGPSSSPADRPPLRLRPASATAAPASAKALAVVRPMPEPAPVTSATLFSKDKFIIGFISRFCRELIAAFLEDFLRDRQQNRSSARLSCFEPTLRFGRLG